MVIVHRLKTDASLATYGEHRVWGAGHAGFGCEGDTTEGRESWTQRNSMTSAAPVPLVRLFQR